MSYSVHYPQTESTDLPRTEILKNKADILRSIIELHCNIFKKETGHFPFIKTSSVEAPGYGDQGSKFLGVNVEISIEI